MVIPGSPGLTAFNAIVNISYLFENQGKWGQREGYEPEREMRLMCICIYDYF